MNDDELMDQILRDAMTAEAPPQLSAAFEANLMRRVRPRRLSGVGRVVIVAYAVMAAAITAWLMRDVPVTSIVAALAITVSVAAGVSAYAHRLAADH